MVEDNVYVAGDSSLVGLTKDFDADMGSNSNRFFVPGHTDSVAGGTPETFTFDAGTTLTGQASGIIIYE